MHWLFFMLIKHQQKSKAGSMRNVFYLCVVSDVKSHVLTVTNVAVLNGGTSTLAADTDCWAHWETARMLIY